ncbi:uncharacterized protein [Nicotiana tomentosiformis]|uniref:Pre-rRNA-processing protein TSR2 homolog isoform X1 n=1 Tax=Nicotiana tabacum TaxID=4097 RepID=A0A1S3XF31_TOBAC|nr:pre-rRNA-processing protein TSR2 homolog isoform X2 [Nicotiana tomentosiformis]XP_016438605.1 PREDICTED: pre-rRNA-processing protein TSR2 homolog isoform X1 [Nicotiana tabacum]XP_016438606.1 PREDICTED: pre-rRNA-processing protein TSR2 homolog isoform X1 [Nicotiana tabacum]
MNDVEAFNANKDEACLATNNRNVKAKSSLSPLQEGISKLLSQWPGLQMAIQNEWGGQDSPQKSKQLSFDILSCLSQSNAAIGVEDVENLLYERLLLSFNTDIDDGSIEEVAEQLMTLREE